MIPHESADRPTPGESMAEDALMDRRTFLKMAAAFGSSAWALSAIPAFALSKASEPNTPAPVIAQATPAASTTSATQVIVQKDFANRLSTVEGLSKNQLDQHLGLYAKYVKKINTLYESLKDPAHQASNAQLPYDDLRTLALEQSFNLNGAYLHELYFGNMGGARTAASERFKDQVGRSFGSWGQFDTQLKSLGKSMRGWVILGQCHLSNQLHLYGLDAHDAGVPVCVTPLLVLDVYEHAYMIDFGTNRPSYLDTFMKNIDWLVVEQRLNQSAHTD